MSPFRERFVNHEMLVGTFIKTPTTHATEILGLAGFDFVVIDEEHAPFDRAQTDMILLAARAVSIAGLVRVPSLSPSSILSVLDCGAEGVLVPHIDSPEKARELVAACRYRGGIRGFSPSSRAASYGKIPTWQQVDAADAAVAAIAMIEDPTGVESIEAIAEVEGLDGFFIGRGDLTVAYGAPDRKAPVICEAVTRILAAARRTGKSVCVMTDSSAEASEFTAQGVSSFIVSSDQGLMKKAAQSVLNDFSVLKK